MVRQPQREKGRLRVAALLDAAQQVFAQDGFDAATMTEIAARAGASIGSLYQYFPTKEHVADAVLARHAEALYQRMQALQDASPGWTVGQLASELFPALLRFRADHPAFGVLAESGRGPALQATGVRIHMRRYVAEILRPHAPGFDAQQLEAMAIVVLQTMKTAVALNNEADLPQRPAVLAQLQQMLALYLAAQLPASA
ncbi:TetR/AcrR family transcriptional regulator [Silvimonas sp. JCM 19000]